MGMVLIGINCAGAGLTKQKSGTARQTARRPEGNIDTSTEKGPFGKDTKAGPRRVTSARQTSYCNDATATGTAGARGGFIEPCKSVNWALRDWQYLLWAWAAWA